MRRSPWSGSAARNGTTAAISRGGADCERADPMLIMEAAKSTAQSPSVDASLHGPVDPFPTREVGTALTRDMMVRAGATTRLEPSMSEGEECCRLEIVGVLRFERLESVGTLVDAISKYIRES